MYIDFVMEEHYFLGLPCLLYIFLKVSSTLMIIVSSTHVDHIFSRDGGGGGAQEDAADLHPVPDPGAGEGESIKPWQCRLCLVRTQPPL